MNISQHGLDFISGFEGGQSSDGLFHAYWDPWGKVWTIGFGETANVHPGMVWTKAHAEAELRTSLERNYEPAVNTLGKLSQNQYDAWCSIVWNLGTGAVGWDIGRYTREHNFKAAAEALLQYDHAGGVRLAGLTRRRQAEAKLLLTPDPASDIYLIYPDKRFGPHHLNERHFARQVDDWLKHPHLHHHALVVHHADVVFFRQRLWVVSVFEPPDFKRRRPHADWSGRGTRYQRWAHRAKAVERAIA